MASILYHPIGFVVSSIRQPQPPENMRAERACLVLEPMFADAAAVLKVGQLIWVIYHLHQVKPDPHRIPADLFTRRINQRPNPIGFTLAQVVRVQGTRIDVIGLDAIDGSPILDIKPYQTIWDAPPVIPVKTTKNQRAIIALTGGPGGGKSTLIEDLHKDSDWTGCFVALPEAVQYSRYIGISPDEKLFQRVIVHLQIGLEGGLSQALGKSDTRPILCHRGSLDPLAFWRQRGWPVDEFYSLVGLSRQEHYQRYAGVIHLVTAADGAQREYTRWPQAHRPEDTSQAIQLDRWLGEAWGDHPHYYRLDNLSKDWEAKSRAARTILARIIGN